MTKPESLLWLANDSLNQYIGLAKRAWEEAFSLFAIPNWCSKRI